LSDAGLRALRKADVVLSLDWVDLAGTLKTAWPEDVIPAQIIQCSVDSYIHKGWSMDYQGLPPVDVALLSEPEVAVSLLLAEIGARPANPRPTAARIASTSRVAAEASGDIGIRAFGLLLDEAIRQESVSLLRLPLGWAGDTCHFDHPLDYLGSDGGGGIGSGPGMAIGSALALQGSGRLPIAVLGDGDFMMGVSAVWTAAHYRIPLLILVSNNRSFYNDEIHQERVARQRARPVENKWIGQHIGDPDIDIAAIARAQGALGLGPIKTPRELQAVLPEAIAAVKAGRTCVVDVRVRPEYDETMAKGLAESGKG
jgi:thiamine pyrophosphate-dependent acetolactate synthase large subunit-like protein